MRIVAGIYGGRRLVAPKGRGVRPTLERVREAVFSALGERIVGARVLDLFAGTGALGFEALSRQAASVCFVESSPKSVDAIEENVAKLGVDREAFEIMAVAVEQGLSRLAKMGRQFDVVFMDPPWESGYYDETLMQLALTGIVKPGGLVVVEHSRHHEPAHVFRKLVMERNRRYGDTCVAYYVWESEGDVPVAVVDDRKEEHE